MSFFSALENDFKKIFGKAPSILQKISSILKYVGPLVSGILVTTKNEAGAKQITNIVAEAESDINTASTLIADNHATPGESVYQQLSTLLSSVQTSIPTLLSVGDIKDPDTVSEVNGVATIITGELSAALSDLSAAQTTATAAPAPQPTA
jgi:hypothetical protein